MPRYFTHYWRNGTWEREWELWKTSPDDYPLNHAADNRFAERGVGPGDYVYPVTVVEGELYLLGRMRVDKVCSEEEAAKKLGTRDLWEAGDHVVSTEYTPKRFDLGVPPEVAARLRFVTDGTEQGLKFASPGHLDRQTLRGVRELDPASAEELDQLLRTAAPPPTRAAPPAFEVRRVYDRRRDIHGPYGGSWQSGIAPSAEWPLVFLFTGQSGERYGYEDRWTDDGVFLYTGEGQVGDMGFVRGNRAVRDHAEDGRDLHLFEALGKGRGCRYLGVFACPTYEIRRGADRDGDDRRVIVFHLVQLAGGQPEEPLRELPPTDAPADRLRQDAYEAASEAVDAAPREAKRLYRARSAAVRRYVLARAGGACEACGEAAPFSRPDETPYLEPHHTRRLSDGGPDHPRWVAAVCPNCHREVHHGAEGEEKNRTLQARLAELET
ncbi:MAG: HNH endonuclease [Actinomycetota bacterium]|nr:HNH endonuclease [Actinomycetota bacterium]